MHIPDGYLSPSTCAVLGAAAAPLWYRASRQVKRTLASRRAPLLAAGAALSFTLMMFNLPVPGGTTAHPVGGTLLAVVLGPWAASLALSAVLLLQALLFGDGGVLAFGANAFNLAMLLPLTGHAVYRLVAGRSEAGSPRRWLGAGLGAYIGINLAGLAAAVELGLQPLLFRSPQGVPLYSPYGLGVAIPAIAGAHLLVAGPAEAVLTALVVRYLQQAQPASLQPLAPAGRGRGGRPLAWALVGLALLTPLGLLAQGAAWGEWGTERLAGRLGYVPAGLERYARVWSHALLPNYALQPATTVWARAGSYIVSALLGAGLLWLAVVGAASLLRRVAPRAAGGDAPMRVSLGAPSPHRLRRGRIEATLAHLLAAAWEVTRGEAVRPAGGRLALDPRTWVMATLTWLVAVSLLHEPRFLLGAFLLTLAAAALAGCKPGSLLRRTTLAVLLFTGLLAVPAVLSWFTPGDPVLLIYSRPTPLRWGVLSIPAELFVTRQGTRAASTLVLRAAVSLSSVLLLTRVNRWVDLLSALRSLGVPPAFAVTLQLTHRYLTSFLRRGAEYQEGRLSRSLSPSTPAQQRRFLGLAAARLAGQAQDLAGEVHAAMLSRGYLGDFRSLRRAPPRAADFLIMACAVAISLAIVYAQHCRGG